MFLKPLAVFRTDWTRELSPSRSELVKLLSHQLKISSRSFLSVPAALFILATVECIIYKQRRFGAAAADSLSVHEYTSHIASAI